MKISQWLHLYLLVYLLLLFLFWNFSVKMCLIFHIVENKASILSFPSQPERGFLNVFLHKSSKKSALLFKCKFISATVPVVPGGELGKGVQVEPLNMTVFSGHQTIWFLRKALALAKSGIIGSFFFCVVICVVFVLYLPML